MEYLKYLLCMLMFSIGLTLQAQSDGDKLFIEGQKLQQVQTVASQNAAIKKFNAAKVVYRIASKKKMCDNQVAICRANIKRINAARYNRQRQDKQKEEQTQEEVDESADKSKETKNDSVAKKYSISLSETRLDFKSHPKEGATQSVKVQANDKWSIASKPEWVEVYVADNKFTVEAQANNSEEARSGIVTVKCGDKEANLVVNQEKPKKLLKVGRKLKNKIFK